MGAVSDEAAVRLAAHYALVDVLAAAESVEEATPRLLSIIGEFFGWDVGALWLVSRNGAHLELAESWVASGTAADAFMQASRASSFTPGEGLPGHVWQSGEPIWVPDFAAQSQFPRSDEARKADLHAAVAMPVLGRDEVLGVIEFLAPDVRDSDQQLLDLMRTLGRQVGQFVERRSAEERMRLSQELTSSIIHSSLDAVITMDGDGMVVDFNPAAAEMFGYEREHAEGRELAELIIPEDLRDAHRRALGHFLETGEGNIVGRRLELSAVRASGEEFPVELAVIALATREAPIFAGFVRDITERVRAEQELERLLEREHAARRRAEMAERDARSVTETLSQSLLPPHLPVIQGLEIGAAFQPAGRGAVGGDFYDVFETQTAGWSCLIGDVCGKGPRAAAATALARYTIRAATLHETRPTEILRILNDAFLEHANESDFCTVAYASLEPGDGRARVSLSVAGHPLPLIVRASGEIETAGEHGTLIGIVPNPQLVDVAYDLTAGDALVFFTDGVTEARVADGSLFGTDRLIDVLRACRGLSAADIARRVHGAVTNGAPLTRDDVAIVALRVA